MVEPIIKTTHKIVRKYDTKDGMVTIGQDKNGNCFARCNECNKNMIVCYDPQRSGKVIGRIAKCQKCGKRIKLF